MKVTLVDEPWNPTPAGSWKSPAPTPRPRGEDVWRLIRDDHVMSCELCDESRDGFQWEVVIRQDGELSFSRRCETERLARYVAGALRQDHLTAGWREDIEKGGA